MKCPLKLRDPADLRAADAWGANCGPASLAAALSLDLAGVRDAVSGGQRKFRGWMGVPEMLAALRWLGVEARREWSFPGWEKLCETELEGPALVVIQYDGPWPASEAAKHRHWVAIGPYIRELKVYDVNAGEWVSEVLWRGLVLPPLLRDLGSNGGWTASWAVELRAGRPLWTSAELAPLELEPAKVERVVVVDGNNLVHRLFHGRPPEFDLEGRPVNAIHGWVDAIRRLRAQHQPDALLAVFDGAGPNWRHDLLPTYKANRSPAPEQLQGQWAGVFAASDRIGLRWVREPNTEADDLIAEHALEAAGRGCEVVVVSSDKDLMQLVRGEGGAGSIRQQLGDGRVFGVEQVQEKFGVGPELVADYLALVGDPQDNVPGVPGVGAKTAARLLREFGGLEQVLAGVERLGSERLRERLRDHAEVARLSRRLVGLERRPV